MSFSFILCARFLLANRVLITARAAQTIGNNFRGRCHILSESPLRDRTDIKQV